MSSVSETSSIPCSLVLEGNQLFAYKSSIDSSAARREVTICQAEKSKFFMISIAGYPGDIMVKESVVFENKLLTVDGQIIQYVSSQPDSVLARASVNVFRFNLAKRTLESA